MTIKSKTGQQVYALVLLAAALVTMTTFAVWPHMQSNRLGYKLANIENNLSGFDVIMAEGENLKSWNNMLSRSNQQSTLLLPDDTMGTAGAYLQKLILKHVTKNGGNVSQVHVLPEIEKADLVGIPVSLNLTTDTKGLRDIIFDLETSEPLIFVQELIINPTAPDQIFPTQAVQKNRPISLSVSMKIIGYMKKGTHL